MAIDYTKFLKPTPVATKSKIDYSKFVQKKYGLPTKSVVIKKEPAKVGTQSPKLTTPKIKDLAKGDNLFADLPFDYDLQGSKKNIVGYQDKKPIFALPKHLDGGTYTKEVTEEGKKESRNIPTETKKEIAGDYVNTLKEVNHIISVARGGTKDRENLEALRTNANFLQKFQKLFGRQFEPSDFTDEQRQEGRVAIEKEIDRDVKSGKISNEEAITKLKRWDFEQDLKVKAKDIAEDTIKTFFKSGSKLFTEAIPEALNFEYKGVGFGKLVDALKKGSDIEPDKAKEFLDKSPIQQYYSPEVVKQLPSATFRGFNNIGVGILSSISSLLGTAEWAGVDKAKPMADKLDKWTEEASSANPKFTDALQQGIGSAATFYLPGAGAMKFSQVIASFSPKLASLAGAGAMGLLESAAESGAVYRDSQKSGDSVEISDLKARGTFLANVALNIVTNKLGIFSDKTKGLFLKGLLSAPLEALQEGTQQLIVNYANDRPLMEGIKEASAIGGILGGFMGAGVSSKTNSLSTKKEPDKELKDLLNKEEAKESATEDPIPSPSVPQIDYSKVINSEQVEQKPQETPSDPLTTEARKYKSAEEFVEAQPKFFHGTYSKDVATKIDREGLAFQKGGTNRGDKISLTKSEDIALTYSGKEGGIVEVFPAKNARIATAEDLPEVKFTTFEDGKKLFNASDAIDAARKKGFDGVDISSFDKKSIGNDVLNEELVILNPSKFQTKSQLTDIWEKANKKSLPTKKIDTKAVGKKVKSQQAEKLEKTLKENPLKVVDQSTGILNKFDVDAVKAVRKNPELADDMIAMITKPDGTKKPAIRESGVFAPKGFETQKFRDIKGLAGGRSYNLRDGAFAFDNITPQQAAKDANWGEMTKISYQADESVSNMTVFAAQQGSKIRTLAKELGVKINPKTGKQLFQALEGSTDVPTEILELSKRLRTQLDEARDLANKARVALGKEEIGYIDSYAPHLQSTAFWRKMMTDVRTTISDNFDYIIPNAKRNPHAMPRKGGMEDLETNAWKLLESYFGAISNDIYSTPIIEQLKAVNSVIKARGFNQMGNLIERHIRENIVGKPAFLDSYLGITEGTKKRLVIQKVNTARNISALAGNVVWSLFVQPASIILTSARAGGLTHGIQNTLGGILDFTFKPQVREQIRKLPTVVTKQKGKGIAATGMGDLDRLGTQIMKSKIDKVNDMMSVLADSIEYWLTGSSAAAGYREAGRLGLKGKNADVFADWLGGATQSRYNKEARPILLNNITIRAGFPFQTYAFELYRYVKTLVGAGGGMPLEKRQRVNQILMLAAGMYVYNQYSEKVTGRTLNTVGSAIPLVGQAVDTGLKKAGAAVGLTEAPRYGSGRAPVAPAEDLTNFIEAVDALVNKGDLDKMRKEMIKWGMGFGGLGGASTVNRFIDGMIATTQGYQETKSGKPAFPVKGKDALLAPFLGVYSTQAGQKYLEGETMARQEANRLLSLSKEQAKAEFDRLLAEDENFAKKVSKEIQDELLGVTDKERKMRGLGVENEERANAVLKELNRLETKEEKAVLWEDYVEKKIITDRVAEQLVKLLKN